MPGSLWPLSHEPAQREGRQCWVWAVAADTPQSPHASHRIPGAQQTRLCINQPLVICPLSTRCLKLGRRYLKPELQAERRCRLPDSLFPATRPPAGSESGRRDTRLAPHLWARTRARLAASLPLPGVPRRQMPPSDAAPSGFIALRAQVSDKTPHVTLQVSSLPRPSGWGAVH